MPPCAFLSIIFKKHKAGKQMVEGKKTCKFMDKIVDATGLLGGILILLTGLFVTYEVVMRYIFNSPTIWVMEISIYIIVAVSFLSLAYVLKEKAHVKIDFITNHLSGRAALILEILTSLLAVFYSLVLGWESGKMALASFVKGELSPTLLRVPMFIPQIFIPFRKRFTDRPIYQGYKRALWRAESF